MLNPGEIVSLYKSLYRKRTALVNFNVTIRWFLYLNLGRKMVLQANIFYVIKPNE